MLICMGEAVAEDVENTAVIVLEAFAPWYDFLKGWWEVGLLMYMARLLLAPTEGRMRELGTIEEVGDRREVLFIVMLFSNKIHNNIQIQCSATRHTKRVQKLFVKWINSHRPIAWMGG